MADNNILKTPNSLENKKKLFELIKNCKESLKVGKEMELDRKTTPQNIFRQGW